MPISATSRQMFQETLKQLTICVAKSFGAALTAVRPKLKPLGDLDAQHQDTERCNHLGNTFDDFCSCFVKLVACHRQGDRNYNDHQNGKESCTTCTVPDLLECSSFARLLPLI